MKDIYLVFKVEGQWESSHTSVVFTTFDKEVGERYVDKANKVFKRLKEFYESEEWLPFSPSFKDIEEPSWDCRVTKRFKSYENPFFYLGETKHRE